MFERVTRSSLFLLVCLVASTGCASSGGAEDQNANVLTREDMSVAPGSNLYDAVNRLRPRWLQTRGPMALETAPQILVYLNRSYLGGLDQLREFIASDVDRVRYMDGSRASATLSGYPTDVPIAGAIIVETASRDN